MGSAVGWLATICQRPPSRTHTVRVLLCSLRSSPPSSTSAWTGVITAAVSPTKVAVAGPTSTVRKAKNPLRTFST